MFFGRQVVFLPCEKSMTTPLIHEFICIHFPHENLLFTNLLEFVNTVNSSDRQLPVRATSHFCKRTSRFQTAERVLCGASGSVNSVGCGSKRDCREDSTVFTNSTRMYLLRSTCISLTLLFVFFAEDNKYMYFISSTTILIVPF